MSADALALLYAKPSAKKKSITKWGLLCSSFFVFFGFQWFWINLYWPCDIIEDGWWDLINLAAFKELKSMLCSHKIAVEEACLWDVFHDDVMTWKCFLHYSPFVRRNHRSLVDSLHKGPVLKTHDSWHGLMTWKCFLKDWPFVWGIHWWLVDSPHKGQVM